MCERRVYLVTNGVFSLFLFLFASLSLSLFSPPFPSSPLSFPPTVLEDNVRRVLTVGPHTSLSFLSFSLFVPLYPAVSLFAPPIKPWL
ncbi:hypothetical protein DER44DRAFT_101981 [Fusarium oxysporum]|nr:hypothetical protein DER44DRAFT_101981 [Fusarium oxysporum]